MLVHVLSSTSLVHNLQYTSDFMLIDDCHCETSFQAKIVNYIHSLSVLIYRIFSLCYSLDSVKTIQRTFLLCSANNSHFQVNYGNTSWSIVLLLVWNRWYTCAKLDILCLFLKVHLMPQFRDTMCTVHESAARIT